MRFSATVAAMTAVIVGQASAYPFFMFPELLGKDAMSRDFLKDVDPDFLKRAGVPKLGSYPDNFGIPKKYIFDEKLQFVDLTGDNEWRAPGPNDERGPCAGLNALANHGFISRDGVVDRDDVVNGIHKAVGLSQDATTILEALTSFFNGDPISGKWSIGGYSPKVATLGPLQEGLLGKPAGICGLGHLRSEGDASITRGDFSQPTGNNNNCRSYPQYAKELMDLAREKYPEDGRITPSILAEHQHRRKLTSIANNPNYFSPPYAGVAFTPAAHHFVFALMANKSEEFPEGYLSPENFMSWFSYTGDPQGEISYTYGHERIPAPFYKRHPAFQWTFADILAALAQQIEAFPTTMAVGGNTGKVNSFAGVNIGDLTGGAVTAMQELTDPAKLGCFLSQSIQSSTPTFISNISPALQQQFIDASAGKLVPALTDAFGACNDFFSKKGRAIESYNGTYPGATAALHDQSRALSPRP